MNFKLQRDKTCEKQYNDLKKNNRKISEKPIYYKK